MITILEMFKKELAEEAAETKRMLKQVPTGHYDWQPHPKSMKLGLLATHLAEIPDMIQNGFEQDKWDLSEGWNPPMLDGGEQLLSHYEQSLAKATKALDNAHADDLEKNWQLVAGDQVYLSIQKWETFRHAMGQNAHHRAQLGVYLRLLNIPIPGPYGPSADETEGLL